VIDGIGALEGGQQRVQVPDIAPHRLHPQPFQAAGMPVYQGADGSLPLDQSAYQVVANVAGGAGDDGGHMEGIIAYVREGGFRG